MDQIENLKRWLNDNDVVYDDLAIEIDHDRSLTEPIIKKADGSTRLPMAIYARRDLAEDEIICTIPKKSILSTKTCSIREVFDGGEIGGAIALTLAVMYEKQLGEKSRFYGYLASLPDYEMGLPLLWSKEFLPKLCTPTVRQNYERALRLLEGTEIGRTLEEDRNMMEQDYDEIIKPFLKHHVSVFQPIEAYSFEEFFKTSTVVAARCFAVDQYHGNAMVPLADVFNHRTAAENVHLESEDLGEAPHPDYDEDFSPEALEQFEQAMLEDSIDMRIVRPVNDGEEVFNTYGDHSNAYLFMKDGFAEPNNPFDVVCISWTDVVETLKEVADEELRDMVDSIVSPYTECWYYESRQLALKAKKNYLRSKNVDTEELEADVEGEISEDDGEQWSDVDSDGSGSSDDDPEDDEEDFFEITADGEIDPLLMCLMYYTTDLIKAYQEAELNKFEIELFEKCIRWEGVSDQFYMYLRAVLESRLDKLTNDVDETSNEYPVNFVRVILQSERDILTKALLNCARKVTQV